MPLPAPILAVIELSFDPLLQLGALAIRWQTVGVTVALLAGLGLAALVVPDIGSQQPFFRRRRAPDLSPSFPDAPVLDSNVETRAASGLRIDDLVLIVLGVVPGAVIGGRLAHVLIYWDSYVASPLSIFDPSVGGLSLLGAVLGGLVSGAYIARMIGAPVRRWADAAAVPFLLALGLGKLAQLLGGSGQGLPFEGAWAVAFLGDGPWVSANPEVPAHPAQVYEGIWLWIGIAVVLFARRLARLYGPVEDGLLFVSIALSWFLSGRILAGYFWRDPELLLGFNGEQVLALAALLVIGAVLWTRERRRRVAPVAVALILVAALTPVAGVPTRAGGSEVDTLLASMSTREKVAQMFMVGVYGDQVAETNPPQVRANQRRHGVRNAAELIAKYPVGGVILYRWMNKFISTKQTARLTNGLQNVALASGAGVPLLISTDQEGGNITRLAAPATGFPGNMALGATRSTELARSAARAIGEELGAMGVNENLAPVADVNVNPANPIIGPRSFSSDASLAAAMTAAQVRGYEIDAGIAASAKHFPGHGDTDVDSHSGLPIINHTLTEWQQIDQPPFQAAIDAGVDVIMSGHIAVPALDPTGAPATLSKPILTDLLRTQMGFDGVVITDGLGMAALKQTYSNERIPVLAILAGADILLSPPKLGNAIDVVLAALQSGEIGSARLDASVRRILELKERLGLFDSAKVNVKAAAKVVGSAGHRAVQWSVACAAVTMLANPGGMLPLARVSGRSVLIVGPGRAALDVVAAAIGKRGYATEVLDTGERPTAAPIASATSRAAAHDYVVLLTHNADRIATQRSLADALAAKATPLISASTGRPYDAGSMHFDAHFALYSDSTPSLRAFVATLFGEVNPTGKLPVTIPGAYAFGFGLTYP